MIFPAESAQLLVSMAARKFSAHRKFGALTMAAMIWTMVCDVVVLQNLDPEFPTAWYRLAYLSAMVAAVGGLGTAVSGWAHYLRMARYTPARGLARSHMILNTSCLVFFALSAVLMRGGVSFSGVRWIAFGLQLVAVLAIASLGWLGMEVHLEIGAYQRVLRNRFGEWRRNGSERESDAGSRHATARGVPAPW